MSSNHRSSSYPRSFDPYLRYAVETRFRYFRNEEEAYPKVVLLVRLRKEVQLRQAMRMLGQLRAIEFGPFEFHGSQKKFTPAFLTVRGPLAIVSQATWPLWDLVSSWVTLSMPVVSSNALKPRIINPRRTKSDSDTLLAIIDDGCPFASQSLRNPSANPGSRVFAIWDQNSRKPARRAGRKFGKRPWDFGYGLEYRRLPYGPDNRIGIDEWMAMHTTSEGTIDEEGCYIDAGFESLRADCSHGAHVLDVMAGAVPPSSGLSFDPLAPPSFAPTGDVASGADVVFVQIPRTGVEDPTGGWLDAQVTDALYFIMSCVDPGKTRHVLVNLSYGPTTRPHDGRSNLEFVMASFTNFYDGSPGRPKLEISVAAGNSRLSDWHVAFTSSSSSAGANAGWTWRVPPDNPVPVFAEIWVPPGLAQHVSGRLLAPAINASYSAQPPLIYRADAPGSASYGWLIVLPPTQGKPMPASAPAPAPVPGVWSFNASTSLPVAPPTFDPADFAPGPHGDWGIELHFTQAGIDAHAYIARSERNMGARTAAKPSRFVDVGWERTHSASADYQLVDGVRDTTGSLVDRKGTLNGIGTTDGNDIYTIGGYRLRDQKASRYSSIGPTRGARVGPDYAFPTDESSSLLGIRAGGNRSGTVFRLIGTSTAAPQLVRQKANGVNLPECPMSDPVNGCGNEAPP